VRTRDVARNLLFTASLAALQGQLFLPAQICTQGQVMFLAHSARMMRAACIARSLDGSRMLFENLGTGHQKRDVGTRARKIFAL